MTLERIVGPDVEGNLESTVGKHSEYSENHRRVLRREVTWLNYHRLRFRVKVTWQEWGQNAVGDAANPTLEAQGPSGKSL